MNETERKRMKEGFAASKRSARLLVNGIGFVCLRG